MRKHKREELPPARDCSVIGCGEPAHYRAPKSREQIHEYQWLCLDHVRVFNRQWDFFKGMNTDQIESFRHDSLTGHRPTWEREDHVRRTQPRYFEALEEGLARFFQWDATQTRQARARSLPAREKRALETLELEDRCTAQDLKTHYRRMAKRCHPDLHPGDQEREERFKQITTAYAYLLKLYGE